MFFSVCAFISLWAVTDYLTTLSSLSLFYNNIFNRAAFLFAFVAVLSCLLFSVNFPITIRASKKMRTILWTIAIIVGALSITSFVSGTVIESHAGRTFTTGSLLIVYIATILLFFGLIIRNLSVAVLRSRGRERQQAKYVLAGFGLPITFGLITNTIVPLLTSNWHTAELGPTFTIFFVASTAYTIVRHRLFDLRLALARSFAYFLSLVAVVALFAAGSFALLSIGYGVSLTAGKELFLALFSAAAALSFQPMKRVFDKLTNKFFYRDAYNPQELFSALNHALVQTTEIRKLLERALYIVETTLKIDFSAIILMDPYTKQPIIVSTAVKKIDEQDLRQIHPKHLLARKYDAVIVTDFLGNEDEKLRNALLKNRIAVLARIAGDSKLSKKEELGYIMLGPKKSGNPYSGQDVRVIETVANELVIAIQNALRFEEIEAFNATLQQKVEEATRKLRATNERLRLLDATKDDFISMASHQLRTPLTSVKGYLSLVLDGDAGPISQSQRKLLTQAFVSSQRMVFLIADLLNVSRLKTGKFIIESTAVNLADVVADEISQLVETAAGRSLKLVYHKPAHFPLLELDETKTRQVIMNFIDNAIYYTPAGGHIEVSLLETPKTVELRVNDDGIGVPKVDQYHLFTKFYRAKNAQKARPDGTGLGLFMAKKVIIDQGGAIIFTSQEGHGSTFGFSMPKTKVSASPPPVVK